MSINWVNPCDEPLRRAYAPAIIVPIISTVIQFSSKSYCLNIGASLHAERCHCLSMITRFPGPHSRILCALKTIMWHGAWDEHTEIYMAASSDMIYTRKYKYYYIFYYHIISALKHVRYKTWHQSARFVNSWPPFCQIWIIFTDLKLWIASARHSFQVGENSNWIIWRLKDLMN